ncbi:glycosyltransferase family 4 protein [Flavobacterium sp. XN-5]|uniref:glycosyltransferase n=1 Tax=Flavobacterium sp. XN-5 TaxID=2599390 RepID=UPI0011C87121|nr:glycosyltransferase [Flavobacterium sp. XN-5]NGY35941.1 glycosyltransferase family 4 protein [Flavobacterium sp. XN-5]
MIKNKNKVAIISTSLGNGGAEKFASLLSFMLENLNIEVHNIIINNGIDFEYGGELLNLGIDGESRFPFFKKIKKGFLLNQYLKEKQIDVVIDNRPRNNLARELITNWIYGNRKKIVVVHSFKLNNYFPKSVFWSQFLYRKTDRIVCVSKAIEKEIQLKFYLKNTTTIYNSYDFSRSQIRKQVANNEDYILYFGRLDDKVKNFNLMLEAFSISKLFEQGIKLVLMGDGTDLNTIEDSIKTFQLERHVTILPFTSNPFDIVQQAKFTVLTSRYEGFPMSILESLALGIPVVAVDCKSGPREIIIDKYNGLLVENYNVTNLANAFNRMFADRELYTFCKDNAVKSVGHLSIETISKQWETILS